MKSGKGFILLGGLVFLSLLNACQKDDICPASTPTTPKLVIRFYSYEDPTKLKQVVGLNLIAEGQTDSLFIDETTTDSIAIPLKTFQNITHYQLIRNVGDEGVNEVAPNADELHFSYFPNEVYVSKACGFKTEYLDLQVVKVAEPGNGNWIKNIVVEQTIIDNETSAHISIFH